MSTEKPKFTIVSRKQSILEIGHDLGVEQQPQFFQTMGQYDFTNDWVAVSEHGQQLAMVQKDQLEALREQMKKNGYQEMVRKKGR
jgi:hypothetical protein